MKLSLSWLDDYVDIKGISPKDLAHELTMRAFEVEDITKIGDRLEGSVVLGEIREIAKHPDADKLQVTQTCIGYNADGSENIQQIVCGARNIAVGQKVPVATIGSKVIDRHSGGTLEIKKSKIRGVESCGMLCSPDELGYSEAESTKIKAKLGDGIYLLYDAANPAVENLAAKHAIGTDVRKVLGFKTDYVLDIGARSNRGDALSIYGQAREISALLKTQVKALKPKEAQYNKQVKAIKPVITDTKDCAVFYTIAIENLKVEESPQWLSERLESVGQKSINNLVDISNYVLLELGQPLHFYDRDKITGETLTIRRATNQEPFKALDDSEHKLSEVNLVVADARGVECLAGVMGGHNTQVTDSTTNIVIEAAAFSAATVRRSARAAGIESESKRRFERGVDKANTRTAILRAVELLSQISNADIRIGELQRAGDDKVAELKVELPLSQVKRYLGIEISAKEISVLLDPLGIKLTQESKEALIFSIPSFRQTDISRAEDLIEEIGRLYGFDKIPMQAPRASLGQVETESEKIQNQIKTVMLANGFSQAILSSLIGESLKTLGTQDEASEITMLNPLSQEHSSLRQSLSPGLIQATSRNYAYDRSNNIKLFELGKVYYKATPELAKKLGAQINKDTNTIEKNKFAVISCARDEAWDAAKPGQPLDFYDLKTIVEQLYPRAKFSSAVANALLHPGISALVSQDKRELGYIGKLHPSVTKAWDLPDEAYLLELDLPKTVNTQFKAISTTPIIERDITVDIAATSNTESSAIEQILIKEAGADLINCRLLSRYQKDKSSPISLSYRLKWQSATETLSGAAIDEAVNKAKNLLERELGVTFRI